MFSDHLLSKFTLCLLGLTVLPSYAQSEQNFPNGKFVDRVVKKPMQRGAAFSPDGSKVVTVGDAIRVFDIHVGEIIQTIHTPETTRDVSFFPDESNRFVVTGNEGRVLQGTLGQDELIEWSSQPKTIIGHIVISNDGTTAITLGTICHSQRNYSGILQRFKLDSGELIETQSFTNCIPRALSYSHDQNKLVVTVQEKSIDRNRKYTSKVLIYETQKWTLDKTISFDLEEGFASGVSFLSGNQNLIITGGKPVPVSENGIFAHGKIWSYSFAAGEEVLPPLLNKQIGVYRPPVSSEDGDFFVTATTISVVTPFLRQINSQVHCLDPNTLEVLWAEDAGIGNAFGIKISPNDAIVSACSDDTLFLFHAKTGHRIAALKAH